jgi:hypothetical protein
MFLTSTRTITEGKDAVIIAEYEDDMVAVFHQSSECVGIYIRDEDDASIKRRLLKASRENVANRIS